MFRLDKKIIWTALPLILAAYLSTLAGDVFAYTPQSLYDDVWKLVKVNYLDINQNGQDWKRWRHKYDGVIKSDEDAYVAIDTMLSSLNDPYTKFLNPDEFAEEGRSISGSLYGVGIQIGIKDDKLLVISPIEDTPAFKAGIETNDEILEINGASTKGISVKDAADKIRGKEGTTVTLLIKRGQAKKTYTLTRAKIDIKAVSIKEPKTVKLSKNVGYIRINSFLSNNTSLEVSEALKALTNKDGYILDIRSNPGGLLTNAIIISDMFLDKGVIVSTVDRDGYKDTQRAQKGVVTTKPVVVLIDEGSASASEILSGALKDNDRAVLVGKKTFGKGLVQEINELPGGTGLNITTQKYLTPNGTDINKVGISPDVVIANTDKDYKSNHDAQLGKAQSVLEELINQSKENIADKAAKLPLPKLTVNR